MLWKTIAKRVGIGFVVLWVVSVIVFLATHALPGDPARAILGRQATPERLAALREQLGLGGSLLEQYFSWFTSALTLDFGVSVATGGAVAAYIAPRLANSLVLTAASAVVAMPIALTLGTWSALRRDRIMDHVVSLGTLVLASMPPFVIGIALVILFSTWAFHLLPAVFVASGSGAVWRDPSQLILPVVTLALAVAPYVIRMMRAAMIEVLESEYIQQARLKGLREWKVILRHAVPNSIGPVVQVVALQLAWLFGGIVVIEYLFRFPGVGFALVDAVHNRDLPVIQAITLLIAALYVAVNLLADVIGLLANPKVRTA